MAAKKHRHRHEMVRTKGRVDPLTPRLHKAIIDDFESGDWPSMVALGNGVSPSTLMGWVLRGLQQDAPENYRRFADEFVAVEVAICRSLVRIVMDRAQGKMPEGWEDGDPIPSVKDAKWLLSVRFAFLWSINRDTGMTRGQSAAEVVCNRIEEMEAEDREKVRKILSQLPDDAKRAARGAGFLVP